MLIKPATAHNRVIKATIPAATYSNLDLKAWLAANTLWDGISPATFDVAVASGAVIGSASTGSYAMTVQNFPSGTKITLTNLGLIEGRGGNGGTIPRGSGGSGGPALYISAMSGVALSIDNATGRIWGGGGGGGGGGGDAAASTSAGGGGGGAGTPGGSGAANGGQSGSATSGGAGGHWVSSTCGSGGTGGGPGSGGATGEAGGGGGGSGGRATTGAAYATWTATGDRRGTVA